MKTCSLCGVEKHEAEFVTDKRKRSGIGSRCRSCDRERRAKAYSDHLANDDDFQERERDRWRTYREGRREKDSAYQSVRRKTLRQTDVQLYKMTQMLNSAKARSSRRDIEFSITEIDFGNWRDLVYCPVFPWIELNWSSNKQCWQSPTIDRIDPIQGYISGNVRIISWRANNGKNANTDDEIVALAEDVLKRKTE